ncbi:MAG: hypothetical protein ACOYN4_09400 [Bacteroidales bacterium]
MKKRVKLLIVIAVIAIATSMNAAFAQPHPGYQSNGGSTGGAPIAGSGAPVGRGEFLLLALAALHGGRKVYHIKNAQLKQM